MQDTNDPIVEETTEGTTTTAPEKTGRANNRFNLRSRGNKNSGDSTSDASSETIGEIQLAPGETLKDDLTANSDSARSKGDGNRRDSRDDRSSRQDREGGGDGRGNRSRRGRERRDGRGGGRGNRGDGKRRETSGQQDREQREGKASGDDRGNLERRGRGRSSGRSGRSGRHESRRHETSEEVKPATWNAGESQSEGFLGKAGKFFSSIFGGTEQTTPSKPTATSGSKGGRGKSRRRRRSRSGNRGGQPRN